MRAFEIQTFKDGEWKVDSIFDDRELALYEAKKISGSTRYAGVKVIQEDWDEATNQTTTRTLFRGGAAKNDMPAKPKKVARRRGHRISKGNGSSRQGMHRTKKSGFVAPILVLVLIVLVAIGALVGLQHLSASG